MTREVDPRLQELYDKGCNIFSISRLNALNSCQYAAWKKYINGEKESSNCWAITGSRLHDCLEQCILGKADESCLLPAIDDELDNLKALDCEFPLDKNGNPTIENNWRQNMIGFANGFKIPKGKFKTEQLLLYHVKNNDWIQGYADVIKYNKKNKTCEIWDWKSSSRFTGEHRIEAARQLILYAIILENAGWTVTAIKWWMMKYYQATWKLKNGKDKTKVGEWRNLITDLESVITTKLTEFGMDEIDIECILHQCKKDNSIQALPDKIKELFKIEVFVDSYELNEETKSETIKYINQQIDLYHSLGTDEKNWKPKDLSIEGAKKNSFWCSSLCGFGKDKKCKYWNDYCDKKSCDEDEWGDLF